MYVVYGPDYTGGGARVRFGCDTEAKAREKVDCRRALGDEWTE